HSLNKKMEAPNGRGSGGSIGVWQNSGPDAFTLDAGGNETRPKNVNLYYIIKLYGNDLLGTYNASQIKDVCFSHTYSETEIRCGKRNGVWMYRRCFTVGSDITSNTTIV